MSHYHMAVGVVRRNKRGRVVERSLIRLSSEDVYERFKLAVFKKFVGYEIYSVNLKEATPPDGERDDRKHLWCPYCCRWCSFNYDSYDGYTKCEVCQISTRDFWTMKYNKLWNTEEMMSPKKKPMDMSEKAKRRRERRQKRKMMKAK